MAPPLFSTADDFATASRKLVSEKKYEDAETDDQTPETMRGRRGVIPPGAVYVGRAIPRIALQASKWANPFKIGRDGTRDEVVANSTNGSFASRRLWRCPSCAAENWPAGPRRQQQAPPAKAKTPAPRRRTEKDLGQYLWPAAPCK